MDPLWSAQAVEYRSSAPSASKRVQHIQRENERNNLLAITHLVLNAFINNAITGNRVLEADTPTLLDFSGLLERLLWHGFRGPSTIRSLVGGSLASDMWRILGSVARTDSDMHDAWQSIDALSNLSCSTPLSRVRAFLRLAIMQKRLSDYFQRLLDSTSLVVSCYEPWALMRDERCSLLAGTFLSLNPFDFNLNIDFDQLNEELVSMDITPYLRIPTLPTHRPQWELDYDREDAAKEWAVVLDQKHYLEERNRQLAEANSTLREELKRERTPEEGSASDVGGSHHTNTLKSLTFTQRLGDLEKERELLQVRLAEKEDALRLVQQQLHDTKLMNEDLYEKLRQAESRLKLVRRDLATLKESHSKDVKELNESLNLSSCLYDATSGGGDAVENGVASTPPQRENPMNVLKRELTTMTHRYLKTVSSLDEANRDVGRLGEENSRLERRCDELERKVARLVEVDEELTALKRKHGQTEEQLANCQQALQELGGHLSESKMKILELREESLPVGDAEWVDDGACSECKLCEKPFSLTHRKHHCRRCGWIFCDPCSRGRVKLPSSAKPVRVCLGCYDILRSTQRDTPSSLSSA